MVTRLGMSDELGTILLGGDHSDAEVFLGRDFKSSKNYSEATACKIDAEIKRIIDEGYALAKDVLRRHMAKLHFIAEYLVKYEVMDNEQFVYVMENDTVTDEDLLRILDERKKRSEEENRAAKEESDRLESEKRTRLTENSNGDTPDPTDGSKELPH